MALTEREEQKSIMLTAPLEKIILRMAYPTIIAFLVNSIYSLSDTYFVSSLGTNATAAVGVNASLDQIIMMAGSMLAVGANSYIARLLGARQEKQANDVLSVAFFLALFFGGAVMILGTIFMRPLVYLLGATATCVEYSIDYATYVLLAAPFMAANYVMNQCLRAEGSATLSMIGMTSGCILNCVLDPIFIFAFDMGIAGASLATAISKLVTFLILVFPYVTRRSLLRISIRNFKPSRNILSNIVSVGSSSLLRNALAVVSAIVMNTIAGNISDSVLAGISVTTKIMTFPFCILLGFTTGFQPVTGFNWGAKRYDRVQKSYQFASKVVLIGSCCMAVVLAVFARRVIGFFSITDPVMEQVGTLAIRLQCLALPIHGWVATVNAFCAALGKAKGAFMLATARQGSCLLPIIPVLRLFGADGIAAAQALADVLTLFLAVPIIRSVMRQIHEIELQSARNLSAL